VPFEAVKSGKGQVKREVAALGGSPLVSDPDKDSFRFSVSGKIIFSFAKKRIARGNLRVIKI
jgi:hypothetical protein